MKNIIKKLNKDSLTLESLQKLFESNNDYFLSVTGSSARANESEAIFAECPANANCGDIIIFGLYVDDGLKAILGLLQNYPSSNIMFLGLLLVDEKSRKMGLGRKLFEYAEKHICELNTFNKIRLGVFENSNVVPFWEKLGFQLTGEMKPIRDEHINGNALIMEKVLI